MRRSRALAFALLLAALWAGCSGKDIVLGLGAQDAALAGAGADAASAGAGADAAPAADASTGDAAAGDAAPADAAAGDDLPRFTQPVAIENIATADPNDDDPSLTADRTELYFNSTREGSLGEDEDIWSSQRADEGAAWSAPVPVDTLNSEARETGIALAPDGLSLLWSSDRPGGAGGLDIYVATRASRAADWSGIARVPELSSAGDDLISALADDGRRVLLARRANEDDDYALFTAERPSVDAAFAEPTPLEELDGDGEESDGFLLADGRSLVFTRAGDLYLAQRATAAGPFGEPRLIPDLNSDQDDRDAWVSADFDYVVFSSERSGQHRLYEAYRR